MKKLDLEDLDLEDPSEIEKTLAAYMTWVDKAEAEAERWLRLYGRDAERTFKACGGLQLYLSTDDSLEEERVRTLTSPLVVFSGRLVAADGGFAFEQKLKFRSRASQLKDTRIWQMRAPDELSPLLEYIRENEFTVSLLGNVGWHDRLSRENGNLSFYACDLVLEETALRVGPGTGTGTRIPHALTQSIVTKLLGGIDAPGAYYDVRAHYSTFTEMNLLYEFYKDVLPVKVQMLAGHSLVDYGRLRGDEQKHALQAATFAWEVDWRQTGTTDIPPCAVLREKLGARFTGMDDVIERLLEIAAAIRRSGTMPKQGVLLYGPAGGGKTMVATEFARLLRLPVERLDLNTQGDRETLCGTSRIYNNATMGEITKSIRRAHSSSMVLLINELDKAARDSDQNASEALLSVLDRTGFYDNFLIDPIPTDNTFVIATANDLSKIPETLLSRFYPIEVKGYAADAKRQILSLALPAALDELKISDGSITVTEAAQTLIVEEYTATGEARGIEQTAARIAHNCALQLEQGAAEPIVYDEKAIRSLLGEGSVCERVAALKPGLAKCVSESEGDVSLCHVEAMFVQGSGQFEVINGNTLTDTYCREAFLYLRAQHPEVDFSKLDAIVRLPVEMRLLKHNTIGIAVYAALLSYLREKALDGSVAFVGGMDMLGNTYLDVPSLDRYLPVLAADASIHTVAVPLGAGQRVYCAVSDGLTLVEAYDAASLNAVCGA